MNQQKTIDAIWRIVEAAAYHIQEWHTHPRGGNHFQFGGPGGWDVTRYTAAAFRKPGEIEYRLRGGAEVRVTGIDVVGVKPENVDVGPIEPAGPQKVVRADVLPNRNATLDDIPWKLTYRDLSAKTELDKLAREVGASLSVGLRQQIGYGSEIAQISGETELTVNMEASFRQAWEREMTAHREHEVTSERDMVVRAMHEAVLERVETVGPARQVIRAKGELTFGIWLHAPGHFWAEWKNLADFCATLQGFDANRSFNAGDWLPFYKAHPVPVEKLAPFQQPVYAESEKVREFEEASNVRVDIKSMPLDAKHALIDALTLLAMKSESTQLRGLAKAELNRLNPAA